jgi:chemotaxis protein histidine kinase CheA
MTGAQATKPADEEDLAASRIRRAEEAIAGLKAQFVVWARADLDAIDAHFAKACAEKDAAARASHLEDLRRVAHNIKGQGGTFGCHDVSSAAADLDMALKTHRGADAPVPARELIEKLRAAFAREAV